MRRLYAEYSQRIFAAVILDGGAKVQVTGQATGRRSQVTDYRSQVTGHRSQVTKVKIQERRKTRKIN